MGKHNLLLIYQDEEVAVLFHKEWRPTPTCTVFFQPSSNPIPLSGKNAPDWVVLETPNGAFIDLAFLQPWEKFPAVLILPNALFKKNPGYWVNHLQNMVEGRSPGGEWTGTQTVKASANSAKDLFLEDFVERKLKDFVKKIRRSRSKNLYSLLVREIEKPLISLTLKETKGNQVQAATILGMNRNTLRKKIKELKIPVKGSA